jgi:hypothetical protein
MQRMRRATAADEAVQGGALATAVLLLLKSQRSCSRLKCALHQNSEP